jgi:hypothetical protein
VKQIGPTQPGGVSVMRFAPEAMVMMDTDEIVVQEMQGHLRELYWQLSC